MKIQGFQQLKSHIEKAENIQRIIQIIIFTLYVKIHADVK